MTIASHIKPARLLAASFLLLSYTATNASAVSETRRQIFAENNIVFYDPEGDGSSNPCDPSSGPITVTPGSNNERLAEVVRQYGEVAMELQREWGTPWEVVFAQMLHESSVGTAGIAVSVANNGYYNWLGITGTGGSFSVGEPYISQSGRKWAQYPSIENMIKAWAGRYIARNGYYDAAFAYTDPNNYNLESFLSAFINVYAPPSDGNDVNGYVSAVLSTIQGTIASVRAEKGWPSSEELAKNENIPIGGRNPLGSSGGGDPSSSETTTCDPNVQPGELVSGGMTLAQAESFLAAYISEASKKKTGHYGAGRANGNVIGDGFVNYYSGCSSGTLNNCVSLSQWFVNNYTTAGPNISTTNGDKYVGYLLGLNKGFIDGGTTPKPYAIGSNQTYNHTFIVLGVDAENDKMIIGEASCHNGYVGSGSKKWPAAREVSITTFSTNTRAIYAYTDNILKGISN